MRLTPRRARLLEVIAEQLAAQVGRPLSPTAALGVVVDRAPLALAALERERAREAARPKLKAYRPDPDAWPKEASPGAARLYRESVRDALNVHEGPDRGAWFCRECRRYFHTGPVYWDIQKREAGRRWWECPTCPPSATLRRKVRGLRRGWSWPNAEARARRAEARARDKRVRALRAAGWSIRSEAADLPPASRGIGGRS